MGPDYFSLETKESNLEGLKLSIISDITGFACFIVQKVSADKTEHVPGRRDLAPL